MADETPASIRRSFNNPDEPRGFDRGRVEVVQVGDLEAMRAIIEPGWTWSECVKPIEGGEMCQVAHQW